MGTWNATIFGNDTSLDIKDEFYERYNRGEEPNNIKSELSLDIDDDDRFNVMFALGHCLWEVGQLDEAFLSDIEKVINNKEDLAVAEELGADKNFLKKRDAYLEKFLEKISVKKEKPKKRVAPPVPVESKYKNGAVMIFKYEDGFYGALIAVNGSFFDKETYYHYLQTDIRTSSKPTVEDVKKARIIDPSFHSAEYNSFRDPKFYYSFVYCISGYLKSTATKRFEKYNDSVFDIIGYLDDWGYCCSGAYDAFNFYRQKTSDEFRVSVTKELSKRFDENPDVRTSMNVEEIDLELGNSRR
ncbi:hypothetical protein [Mogibacterium pumilum]|uniref:DUF4259 domain-containing protein n=1 Tax=Mogibacterium pumilum TaxID=86332 RepID=A0A223ASN7_9FIRM|nr:hypothetical protein [Mogibacterium pumilum]ASS37929.1 hypothetical protein AXF17_05445 [Mogibacterium pumilum]